MRRTVVGLTLSRARAFASAPGRDARARQRRRIIQHRAPTRPERAGRAVEKHPSIRLRRSVTQQTSWWTQKGRGRLGHRETESRAHGVKRRERPPTPLAPKERGAQRGLREDSERRHGSRRPRNEVSRTVFPWSRDAERPRDFGMVVTTRPRSAASSRPDRHR